jgi:AraC-like DNA-binding protein
MIREESEIAVVGGDHAPLRAVHEHAHAAQVGFEDPAYFSRVFRKQIGHSPQRYRERLEA